jgi:hypothetical protein
VFTRRQGRYISNLHVRPVAYDARVANRGIHCGRAFADKHREGTTVHIGLLSLLTPRVGVTLQAEVKLAIPFEQGAQFQARDISHLSFCQ